MNRSYYPIAAVVTALLAAMPATAASQLKAGHYTELHFVTAASAGCLEPVGAYFTTEIYYPGPSKSGFLEWAEFNTANIFANEISSYPTTPAAGVTTWSGSYTSKILPGGKSTTGTFSNVQTVTDASSAVVESTVTYPTSGGTCTTKFQMNQVYTGK